MKTSVVQYLEENAAIRPDNTAFADAKNSITYSALLSCVQSVATFVAKHSKGRCPVAVLGEKSCNVVAAFLGIAYAGCFYVPLDPKHPAERLNGILDSLCPVLILVEGAAGERAAASLGLFQNSEDNQKQAFLLKDALDHPIDAVLLAQRRRAAVDIDPLYAIFTSGSTGKPKGVLVSHRSVIDFIEVFSQTFGFDETTVFGNQAPFDFDVSVKDIYTGLRCGARVELLEKSLFSFPVQLLDRLEERGVNTLVWAVSALVIISTIDALAEKRPEKLANILFSGETMPIRHLTYWRQHYPDAKFVNLYGPTEITCNCTYYQISPEENFAEESALPIGSAFPNEQVFLLDSNDHEITSPGEVGELCVAGTCLALGYLNDPERTQAVFCQNPLTRGWPEKIYRTGDLACYGENGLLYFRSRKDFQIKHMGHRIELQEIELHIQSIDNVNRCCCVFFKDRQKIVAFYEGTASTKEIIGVLRKKLPPYMIPNVFEQLERLPITPNGKIDRTKLSCYTVK